MIEEKNINKIQEYLVRIIARFFESERINTESSIEAIVVESLRRLHESMAAEINYVFSVNAKTGKVNLTPYDIGAEEAFKKRSSFNVNFGEIAETILKGDSIYLSDKREPLNHGHLMNEINQLILNEITSDGHIHKNKTVLDLLKYTGTSTSIDLIIVEKSKSEFAYTMDAVQKELIKMDPKRAEIVIRQKSLEELVLSKLEEHATLTLNLIQSLKEKYQSEVDLEIKTTTEDILNSIIDYSKKDSILVYESDIEMACFNKSVYLTNSTDCQKSSEIKTALLKDNGATKNIFATIILSYEFEIPETGEIEINIKTNIAGKENHYPGCHIAAADGFYGNSNYETIQNKTKIKISLHQSKIIYDIPSEFIIGEKKIFALSQTSESWDDSVTNFENGFGQSMATIDNAGENILLSGINDAWIRGKKFNDEWVWYNGPVEEDNTPIEYSNWASGEPINAIAVFNPTGWTTGTETDLKRSIIEWKFETPEDICESITFISKVRKG